MAVLHNPDSGYAKERVKYEAQNSILGEAQRPYIKRDYPTMLHLAGQLPQGGIAIIDYQTVDRHDPAEARLRSQGYRDTPLEAIDHLRAQQVEFATLAAEREYDKRHGMSERARAEVEAIEEAAGAQHLPTIPETPIKRSHKKRGRPPKSTPPVEG